jgi:hypothetical protein
MLPVLLWCLLWLCFLQGGRHGRQDRLLEAK